MKIKKMLTAGLLVACGAVVVPGLAMAAINGSNSCHDCTSQTGDAHSSNSDVQVVGQNGLINLQDGDNSAHSTQDANALTGDANSGQVLGQVGGGSDPSDPSGTGTGGSTINASNSCTDCDSQTGESHASNSDTQVVGQNGAINVQDGNNSAHSDQTANSGSGDANSGQVVGQAG